MKCKICGGEKFFAHQQAYHDILVDGDNQFLEDKGVYESEHPYGPYTCDYCGAEYEELDDKCKLNEAMRFRVGPIQSGLRKTHLLDAKWTRAYFKTRYGTNMSDNDIQSKLDAMPQEEQELFLTQVDADAFVVLAE